MAIDKTITLARRVKILIHQGSTVSQLVVTVDMVIDIPSKPFTAKVTRVVNSIGSDITSDFVKHCRTENLPLTSQPEIEVATESFTKKFGNTSILP